MDRLPLPGGCPGLGVDLVEVERFRSSLEHGGPAFRDRLFTAAEQAECEARPDPAPHYAARFAVKEAAMKALGTGWSGGLAFTDFEVHSDGRSAPGLQLRGRAAERAREAGILAWRVSLSHTRALAVAVVLAVAGDAAPGHGGREDQSPEAG